MIWKLVVGPYTFCEPGECHGSLSNSKTKKSEFYTDIIILIIIIDIAATDTTTTG